MSHNIVQLVFLLTLAISWVSWVTGSEYIDVVYPATHAPHLPHSQILINPEYEKKLAEYAAKIVSLQIGMANMNATLLSRILWLEANHYNNILTDRVTSVENRITNMKTNLHDEVRSLSVTTNTKIDELGQGMESQISALDRKMIATKSLIQTLEGGKVQRLLNQNEVWRKNFRRLNTTINRLGRARG